MTSMTEYNQDSQNDIIFDLNDISTFLYSIGYLSQQKFNNIKKHQKTKQNNEIIFENNLNITMTDASVKYYELLQEINKKFNTNLTFEENYTQYKIYTKTTLSFGTYLNYLIIIVYILNNYSDLINIKNILNISKEKISVIEVDTINTLQSNTLNNDLENLYKALNDRPFYKDKEVNANLVLLIFFISNNNNINIDPKLNSINDFILKYSIYNKLYVSNIDLGLMLYIVAIIFIYRYSSSIIDENSNNKNNINNNSGKIFNKSNQINTGNNSESKIRKKKNYFKNDLFDKLTKPFTSRTTVETSKNIKNEIGELTMTNYLGNNNNLILNNINDNNYLNDKNNIPNLYLFENEVIQYPYNPHITVFMFQNYLKLLSFYCLDKYKINLLVNLTIKNLFDFKEEFIKEDNINDEKKGNKKNFEEDEEENVKDYYSLKNNKNFNFKIFNNINEKSIKYIYLQNVRLFTNNLIYLCFKSIYLNELLIKVACFDEERKIEKINLIYIDLIKKSNICFIQEPPIISQNIVDNLSMNDLYLQYNILCFMLDLYSKSKNLKKSEPTLITFKFSTFKCHINRENKIIQLFFDFSKIKEKTLFHYLKKIQKLFILEQKYENIINLLREYKNYDIKIRLTQSNFRSHQVSFLFSIIIKKIVDFIDEMKLTKINVLEANFNNFNPNMKLYIRNNRLKKKPRMEQIKKIIQSFPLSHKVRALNNYLSQLEENFELIMLSDNYNKDFRLVRKCDENKIFFFICKETKKINLLEKEKQKEENKFGSTGVGPQVGEKKDKLGRKLSDAYNEYLNIIFYIKSDQISFINIINFLDDLIEDEQCEIQNNITIICDRFYLESYVIMEQSLKSTTKKLFSVIDNYFLIAKKLKNNINENSRDKEFFNYDIYIADDNISVANYHQYNYKKNKNYSELVFEFLSCLSSCIELIIYTLRTKDIYLQKFFYILRTINDKYFIFEYKNSNIFFKKIKEFDTLLFFNPKKAEPLLCLLPKIPESEYTMSINNFYDVYLRLFLNLNKVEEQKEKLSQIFLYKIHKNIFYENYDSIILISFSYQAFNIFNDFFMVNNFLSTTKEKFNNIYFFPFYEKFQNNEYISLLKNQLKNSSVVKNIYIYDYGFNSSSKFNNPNYFLMGYRKSEYLLDKSKELIDKNFNENNKIKKILFKCLINKKCDKKYIKKSINNIILLWNKNENFNIYHLNIEQYQNVLKNYQKNVYQIETQKVDKRLQNLTEDAINNFNHLKNKQKQCNIF